MVRKRIAALDEDDLRWQAGRLGDSLSSAIGSRFASELERLGRTAAAMEPARLELLQSALWIGRELLHRAQRADDGSLEWRFPDRAGKAGAAGGPYDLYDGRTGVALFLAALGSVTGDMEWAQASAAAFEPVGTLVGSASCERDLAEENIGICEGLGSIVYGSCLLAGMMKDDAYLETAARAARSITADKISGSRSLDVMGGVAGALLSFLTLHSRTAEHSHLELARICGSRLLAERVLTADGGAAWPATDRRLLAGFAHGASGIAYALGRLALAVEDDGYRDTAAAAYRFERSLFSPSHGNWPLIDGRGGRQFMNAWCHGAPGIGLARALTLDLIADEDIESEIGLAVQASSRERLGRSDHLCCGNMGRADIVQTIGERLGSGKIASMAEAITIKVSRRAAEQGHFMLPSSAYEYRIFAPGFFRGLSGIGYQLLRSAAPARLPSITGFEERPYETVRPLS